MLSFIYAAVPCTCSSLVSSFLPILTPSITDTSLFRSHRPFKYSITLGGKSSGIIDSWSNGGYGVGSPESGDAFSVLTVPVGSPGICCVDGDRNCNSVPTWLEGGVGFVFRLPCRATFCGGGASPCRFCLRPVTFWDSFLVKGVAGSSLVPST